MKRQIVYPGQIPLDTDLALSNKNILVALGHVLQDMLGTSTLFSGLGCVPTSPAGMTVNVNPGRAYSLQAIDTGAYGSVAADAHQIVKQGILLDAVNFSCPAPVTAGYSINYLVEAAFQEVDTGPTVLPYYNAANPAQAFSGPNGNGTSQATARDNTVQLQLKAGNPATTGSQVTPTPDAGFTGLWVITVPYGAATITSSNISQYAGAPFLTAPLLTQIQAAPAIAGTARNLSAFLAAQGASATWTADEILIKTALGGQSFVFGGVSLTVNLGASGMGGVIGTTPATSGFAAIYAATGPAVPLKAFATDATAVKAPEVYGGTLSAGYTASQLIAIVPMSSTAGQFAPFSQTDRRVGWAGGNLLTGSTFVGGPTARPDAAHIPLNARFISGFNQVGSSAASAIAQTLTPTSIAGADGQYNTVNIQAGTSQAIPFRCAIVTPQTIYQQSASSAGTPGFTIATNSYEF